MKFKKLRFFFYSLLSNKLVKLILIPAVLLILWLSLSLFYSSYRSFTVLQYAHNGDAGNKFFKGKLLRGSLIKGVFEAQENHLGIVSVRFGLVPEVDYEKEDLLIFRIKEKNIKNWLYQNKYRSGAIESNHYYTFGFSELENSKGKTYEFEIESLNGNLSNAIEVVNVNPIYLTKYKFSVSEILKSPGSAAVFMKEKLITFFTNIDTLLSSTVFLLPFIFYVIWTFFSLGNRFFDKWDGKKIFALLIFLIMFLDIILYPFIITGFMLALVGLWTFSTLNKFESKITFGIVFLLILISATSIYFHLNISVDKATSYAYLLLLVGFFESIKEYKEPNKKTILKKKK